MLTYLIIQLDRCSVSFCHYDSQTSQQELISVENLRKAIIFAMKENLTIQFLYSDANLPAEHEKLIRGCDHIKIKPACAPRLDDAQVIVARHLQELDLNQLNDKAVYIWRCTKAEFFEQHQALAPYFAKLTRLNITLLDIDTFSEEDFKTYDSILAQLSASIRYEYLNGHAVQLNLLTDRMMLKEMNNCDAGTKSLTLAPDGQFYICPGFYQLGQAQAIGNLEQGLAIKNPQLYQLSHAPICRKCDAYQCRRCIYLNRKTTLEVNTPSHEQCVLSHLERNRSRQLMHELRHDGITLSDTDIKAIDYLDPFDIIKD